MIPSKQNKKNPSPAEKILPFAKINYWQAQSMKIFYIDDEKFNLKISFKIGILFPEIFPKFLKKRGYSKFQVIQFYSFFTYSKFLQ